MYDLLFSFILIIIYIFVYICNQEQTIVQGYKNLVLAINEILQELQQTKQELSKMDRIYCIKNEELSKMDRMYRIERQKYLKK